MDRGNPKLRFGLLGEWTTTDGEQGQAFPTLGVLPLVISEMNIDEERFVGEYDGGLY